MSNKCKGVRAKNKELTFKMRSDLIKGYSYGQLELKYKVDKSNIRKRVLKLKRKPQVKPTIKWACHNKW